MHGVRRGSRLVGAAATEAQERERENADLCRRALQVRQTSSDGHLYSKENTTLVSRALERNGEEYSLWNYRREMILAKREECKRNTEEEKEDESNTLQSVWLAELQLTQRALRWMPKAYGTWAYRLFLLGLDRIEEKLKVKVLKKEQLMVEELLKTDPRNFHGWAHRMRLRQLRKEGGDENKKEEMERELKYVESKINDDFANYSAWHVRSRVLPKLHEDAAEFLGKEFEFVQEAFYTDPDVQSTWFYHRWLLASAPQQGKAGERDRKIWERELKMCNELLEIEPNARFALHAKAFLLGKFDRIAEAKGVYMRLIELVR